MKGKKTMKAMNPNEAWAMANEIFPTDYEYDSERSSRCGYPVYASTVEGHYNDYICDLNARLEVNLSDGRSINIWIDESYWEEEEKETKIMVEDSKAAKEYGSNYARSLYVGGVYKEIILCVDGSKYNDDPLERRVYDSLGRKHASYNASDLIVAYCESHGIKWLCVSDIKIEHFDHGKNGINGGHYIIKAFVQVSPAKFF